MGKKKSKVDALREELEGLSVFKLKRTAAADGVPGDVAREASKEDLIEAIIEARYGDGDDDPPPKKGKKKPKPKGKKKPPPPDDDDDDPDPDDDDDSDDDDPDPDDDDSGEDDGENDAGSGTSGTNNADMEVLEAKVDATLAKVEELAGDIDALTKFAQTTLEILKSGMLRIGAEVGTKGMKKRFGRLEAEFLNPD